MSKLRDSAEFVGLRWGQIHRNRVPPPMRHNLDPLLAGTPQHGVAQSAKRAQLDENSDAAVITPSARGTVYENRTNVVLMFTHQAFKGRSHLFTYWKKNFTVQRAHFINSTLLLICELRRHLFTAGCSLVKNKNNSKHAVNVSSV